VGHKHGACGIPLGSTGGRRSGRGGGFGLSAVVDDAQVFALALLCHDSLRLQV